MSAPDLRFELPGGGRALFTGRSSGNMSSVGGEDAEHGAAARERLRAATGTRALARGFQVHGTRVERVLAIPRAEIPQQQLARADGQATALGGVGALVLGADCLPVALGCDGAVAMVHAGWRGLAAGVLEEGVRALRELSGAAEIAAVIGPGAGACCYEVDPSVHQELGASATARAPVDLRAIARARLHAAGVADVREVQACTICDERFFSHRREGAGAGRQAGVAWLS